MKSNDVYFYIRVKNRLVYQYYIDQHNTNIVFADQQNKYTHILEQIIELIDNNLRSL